MSQTLPLVVRLEKDLAATALHLVAISRNPRRTRSVPTTGHSDPAAGCSSLHQRRKSMQPTSRLSLPLSDAKQHRRARPDACLLRSAPAAVKGGRRRIAPRAPTTSRSGRTRAPVARPAPVGGAIAVLPSRARLARLQRRPSTHGDPGSAAANRALSFACASDSRVVLPRARCQQPTHSVLDELEQRVCRQR